VAGSRHFAGSERAPRLLTHDQEHVPVSLEVFVNSKRLMAVAGACMMVLMLRPAEASAQRRAPGGHPTVVVHGPIVRSSHSFYRPSYRPYYDPFFYGSFYYDPFYLGWYPNPYAFSLGYGYGYGYEGYQYRPGYYYGARWSAARIEIKPREAQVFLDGYYVGIVDQFDGIFQRLDVPVGEHDLAAIVDRDAREQDQDQDCALHGASIRSKSKSSSRRALFISQPA